MSNHVADHTSAAQPWWKTSTVYQIYPRSFADTNGDGFGDVRGIIDRLGYLSLLGVDVLWLSPIYKSPQDDNGYDISDYQDIDPMFGSLADVEELIAKAKDHGIRIVMDLVVNHSSDEHPWFVESRSSKDNPKRDWYIWRPAREDGGRPNNWSSFFSGSVWEWDETTQEYFLHLFSKKQPDLNWENPELRRAVYDMMNWWLDKGVAGFRMDVINLISKVPGLPDGEQYPGDEFGNGFPLTANGPRLSEFLQEMHSEVFGHRDDVFLTVGECPGIGAEFATEITNPANAMLDMVFQFEHVGIDQGNGKWDELPFDLLKLKRSLGYWQTQLGESGWNSLYWNNHDQPRILSRWGNDREYRELSAKLLGTVLHFHRGTPYVYQGEELGMTNFPFESIDQFQDLETLNHYNQVVAHGGDTEAAMRGFRKFGRDNARTPMHWDGSVDAAFSKGKPWLKVNPNHEQINAAQQIGDLDSVFHYYRRLIALRKSDAVMAHGDFTMLLADDPQVYAFTRTLGDEGLLVIANWSDEACTRELPLTLSSPVNLIQNYADSPEWSSTIALRPWEVIVYRW
ncbi:MAG: hypothetical protein RL441_1039 [Actinomycetota bacterium]